MPRGITGAPECRFAAKLGIDLGVIDDVVAVHRTGLRLEDRRGIDVADAELRVIAENRHRIGEAKALVKLQPGRCARRRHDLPRVSAMAERRRSTAGSSKSFDASPA